MSWEQVTDNQWRDSKNNNRATITKNEDGTYQGHVEYNDGTGEDSPVYKNRRSMSLWVSKRLDGKTANRKEKMQTGWFG